jgi:hypothetical protein
MGFVARGGFYGLDGTYNTAPRALSYSYSFVGYGLRSSI